MQTNFMIIKFLKIKHLLLQGFWIFWALRHNSEKAMATHSSTLAWKIPWMGR